MTRREVFEDESSVLVRFAGLPGVPHSLRVDRNLRVSQRLPAHRVDNRSADPEAQLLRTRRRARSRSRHTIARCPLLLPTAYKQQTEKRLQHHGLLSDVHHLEFNFRLL